MTKRLLLAVFLGLATGGARAQITAIAPFPGGSNGQLQYNNSFLFEGVSGTLVQGTTVTLVQVQASTAVFGTGTNKSTFTSFGSLVMAANSSFTLSGAGGIFTGQSSVTASAFFGWGGNLLGIPSSGSILGVYLPLSGGGMSGEIRMVNSSMSLTGSSGFITSQSSVNASSFFGPLVGNADTASRSASTGTAASSGFLCRGVSVYGWCLPALVDGSPVNGSTNPVASDALFDHNADAGAHAAGIAGNSATASALAALPVAAVSGKLCRGILANGDCREAHLDTLGVSGSTNPVTAGALFTHAALSGTSAHGASSVGAASQLVSLDANGAFQATRGAFSGSLTASTFTATDLTAFGVYAPTRTYAGTTISPTIYTSRIVSTETGSGAFPFDSSGTVKIRGLLDLSDGGWIKWADSRSTSANSGQALLGGGGTSVTTLAISSFSIIGSTGSAPGVFNGSTATVAGMTKTMYLNTTAKIQCVLGGLKINADAGTECYHSVAFGGTVPSTVGGEQAKYKHDNNLETVEMRDIWVMSGRLGPGTISVAVARWSTGAGSCNDGAGHPKRFIFQCWAVTDP